MLRRSLAQEKGRVLVLALLLAAGIGLQLAMPQLLQRYLDTARAGGMVETLAAAGWWMVALTAVRQVVQVLETYVGELVGWAATNRLRTELMLHSLRLDMSFHKDRTPGEMIERIDGDVTMLANFFSRFVVQIVGNVLLLVGVVVVLFWENVWMGAAFAAFTMGALWVLHAVRRVAIPHWAVARQASAVFYGFLSERLAGTEDIRANGGTAYVMRRFFEQTAVLLQTERIAYVRGRALWPATIGLFAAGYLLVFLLGGHLLREGAITVGTLYLMFGYMELLRSPLDQITVQLQDFQKAGASLGRVQELLGTESRLRDDGQGQLPEGALAVELDGVNFGYGAEARVLQEVSVMLRPGRVLGLLGRTGSGKTTLTRLLLRLYDADAGAVRIGGVDVQNVPVAELRRRIGVVTQEVRLFGASVRDNMTLFDPSVADKYIRATLDEVGLGEWLRALPQGLDTQLAPGGGGLSAGQAQLLAFARVFLQDPGLVILDEASSRLDPATERLVDRAVARLLKGRTAILIAHRLQTVQGADEILILEQGTVLEHGEREALLQNSESRLAALMRAGMEEVLA